MDPKHQNEASYWTQEFKAGRISWDRLRDELDYLDFVYRHKNLVSILDRILIFLRLKKSEKASNEQL
jgi:hypothetical protein